MDILWLALAIGAVGLLVVSLGTYISFGWCGSGVCRAQTWGRGLAGASVMSTGRAC